MSRRTLVVTLVIGAVVIAIVGLVVFKPWLLFVDVRVDDALPEAVTIESSAPTPSPSAAAVPVVVSTGVFVSHEHDTSGSASIIRNPDGSLVLALADLATSNGPDVHVWLSAADVVEGVDGWYTAGGAAYLDLGAIKGNLGNQVYEVPAGTDLSQYRSVELWCVQFSVSFGAAQLQ